MKRIAVFVITCLILIVGIAPASVAFASDLSDSVVLHLTATHTDNQVVIDVNMITNTGISSIGLELVYDRDVFEFDDYERGQALDNFLLTPSEDFTKPIRFLWDNLDNQSVANDFSTGNLLRLYFRLKPDCKSGDYNIVLKPHNISYYDNNNHSSLKSAIIDKAVINIAENKITAIEIEDADVSGGNTNVALLVGAVVFGVTALSAAVAVLTVKIIKKRRGKGNWSKI